jgi:hypothetical protein
MSIKNAITNNKMNYTNLMSRDKKSYKMLPIDSEIWFIEISKKNKTIISNEIKGPGRIIKPLLEWCDIQYTVEYPIKTNNYILTKASLIHLSEP